MADKFKFIDILLIIYLAGIAVVGWGMIRQLFLIIKSISGNRFNIEDSAKVIRTSEYPSSFSFFNFVFINPSVEESELREIMNHELVHVKQKHWLDLLLVEILRMLQWINPFVWMYGRFIRLNHEYLADEVALQRSSDPLVYKAALLNQLFRSPVISLSNSFNYSINKKRFEMMKKIVTSPYRKLKVLYVLPVLAIGFYAFAKPEFQYSEPAEYLVIEVAEPEVMAPGAIPESNPSLAAGISSQKSKEVKGTVLREDGKPFTGVPVMVTGTKIRTKTDDSGSFTLAEVPEDAQIVFSYRGYLTQVVKPQFSGSMTINLEKDPDYKAPVNPMSNFLIVIDGVVSEKSYEDGMKDVTPDQIASLSILKDKKATDKYGEKGKNGVIEIMTRKKADELGIKIPFRRQKPDDYPTFQGASHSTFNSRVIESIQYPPDAINRGISGVVTVGFVVESDGTISNINAQGTADQSITDAVVNAIKESPKWEPAKNPEGQTPFSSTVSVEFKLPGTVTSPEIPFVVVEEMPVYPGGDGALLDFIRNNLKYPEEARQQKLEGRVIIRFAVNTLGKAEQISILKGVNPLLDAEAFRIVGLLKDFRPGYQGGKPVPVWYMVPVTFSLGPDEKELEKLESAPAEQPH